MRIATYNIWNETKGSGDRLEQIIAEINTVNADIIGLQEVTQPRYDDLAGKLGYRYHTYAMYRDEDEGLAFFSRYPFDDVFFLNTSAEYSNSAALHVLFNTGDFTFSVTNLHLPWSSILAKEKQILAIDRYIKEQKDKANFFIMLGDFNCTFTSSVHNYLIGEQSLNKQEAKPSWFDLGSTYAAINGLPNEATLHFQKNPRWTNNTTEMPVVYDRILIRNSYGRQYDEDIKYVGIFGTAVSAETGLAASDHYGVFADVEFML
jgi:endonuclease/exonuclease/phosphatase family metal-dependent hydrolase